MHLRGIGYAFAASLMFGLGAVLAQLLGKEIDATVAAILVLVGGGILLVGILVLSGSPLLKVVRFFKWRQWLDIFLLSCAGTSLPLLLIVAGFARTSALEGGFLLQVNGVAALIFAVILLKERIRIRQGFGILLLLLGSVLVVFKGTQGIDWSSGGLGDALILGGAIGLGFGFIPAKRLTLHIEPLPLTALRLLLGACTLVPILIIQLLVGRYVPQWQPSLTTLWVVLPVYILTNFCLGYLVQQMGLVLLKAWEMAAVMQTVPLFSTIFALLLLHDSMTLLQAAGGSLAILGGIIVSLNKDKPTTDSHLKP